jgi:hypothetical protein
VTCGLEPGQAEEPIWDAVVQIDDRLATVWVKYELIFNGEFHHCGIDAFELWRSDEGWKIFQLTDYVPHRRLLAPTIVSDPGSQ